MQSETLSTEPYKGVRDFYPAEWAQLQAIFNTMREMLLRYGYEEYNASPLERAELYESKGNEEIVSEQTYTFEDRGGRRVTLRPEMTPTLARMVAAKRREIPLPARWFSIPNVFRYERPQKGRLREHYQLNVDLLGVKDAMADGEIIVIAHALLSNFGATNEDFVVRVNSRTLLDAAVKAAGMTGEVARAYLRLLDKKDKMPAAEFAAAREALGAIDPLSLIMKDNAHIAKEKQKLLSLIETCGARGMTNVVFDPTIVRGFDYYTGIIFEIFDTNTENPRALFGGGRYDNLIELFSAKGGSASGGSGELVPAVGFGMGDVTLYDFLTAHDLLPEIKNAPELYLGTPASEDLRDANLFAESLRTHGLRVFVNLSEKSLGDQIKDANKRGIPYFAAVGADEHASRVLKVKRLGTGEEKALALADVAHFIRS